MDGQIRIRKSAPAAEPGRQTLSLPQPPVTLAFTSGAVDAIPDLGEQRFTIFPTCAVTVVALRKAILDCAHQAMVAEPVDTDRRLHSFLAKLSGTMEGLGERELDAALWNLMETKAAPPRQCEAAPPAGRKATADERFGMDWWNTLTEERRRHWLGVAKSASPADAWDAFKASGPLARGE